MLYKWLGVMPQPVYCTKIASRLSRTYTDKHGLKDLTKDLLGKDISKQQQLTDWGAETLTEAQVAYAADDVLNLHALKDKLDVMLAREGRTELAAACFAFLPTRARLDLCRLGRGGHFRAFLSSINGSPAVPGPHSQAIFPLRRRMIGGCGGRFSTRPAGRA